MSGEPMTLAPGWVLGLPLDKEARQQVYFE